jgi:hypothetical protein
MDRAQLATQLTTLEQREGAQFSVTLALIGVALMRGVVGLAQGTSLGDYKLLLEVGLLAAAAGLLDALRLLRRPIRDSLRAHILPLLQGGLLEDALATGQLAPGRRGWIALGGRLRPGRELDWFVDNYVNLASGRRLQPYPYWVHGLWAGLLGVLFGVTYVTQRLWPDYGWPALGLFVVPLMFASWNLNAHFRSGLYAALREHLGPDVSTVPEPAPPAGNAADRA